MPSRSKAAAHVGAGSNPPLHAPVGLKRFQDWFARAASRPLLPGNRIRPAGVEGASLAIEAGDRLRSHNGMSGLERLEVYNRQYWFRLITCMQEDFTCAVHAMGLDRFNAWSIRYLDAHPSDSPYLADLNRGFVAFLEEGYRSRNRAAVLEAARYDKAFARAFEAPDGKPLRKAPTQGRLALAPHATALWLTYDFQAYRALCHADEELTGKFPLRRRAYGACVYRLGHTVYEKEITRPEFRLLSMLEKPATLAELFEAVEAEAPARELKSIERNLAAWFRDWTTLGLIASAP